MNIRKLHANDAFLYQRIRLKALKENPEYYSSSYEEESVRKQHEIESRLSHEYMMTYGAFYEGKLVGIVTLSKETRHKTKHIADIFGMYVDSQFRHQGFGKALMSYVIEQAKSFPEIKKIRLSVTVTNHIAIQLYESFGFDQYGLEKHAILYQNIFYHSVEMELFL